MAVAPVPITTTGHKPQRATEVYRKRVDQSELIESIRTRQVDDAHDPFLALWYLSPHTWRMTQYCGTPILKNPLDLQIYHELIMAVRPSVIVETGTGYGGSALWFAHQLDLLGGDRIVVTVDVVNRRDDGCGDWPAPEHERIRWVNGDVMRDRTLNRVTELVGDRRALVSLDACQDTATAHDQLAWYAPLTSVGSYCVVEGTILSGRPLWGRYGENGPGPAVDAFLAASDGRFEIDARCERYLLTTNPGGWLRRVR